MLSPDLLTPFRGEADELREHKHALSAPLRGDKALIESVQQIFRGVLRGSLGVEVTSFTQDEKQEALDAVERLVENEDDAYEHVEPLVNLFGVLCDQWPDILDVSYGGSSAEFREFRVTFIPELLYALELWADGARDDLMAKATKQAVADYESAVSTVAGSHKEEFDE